jgi:hypothetical protein
LYSTYSLIHFNFPAFLTQGLGGIVKSFAQPFIVILIAGFLESKRIRLSVVIIGYEISKRQVADLKAKNLSNNNYLNSVSNEDMGPIFSIDKIM